MRSTVTHHWIDNRLFLQKNKCASSQVPRICRCAVGALCASGQATNARRAGTINNGNGQEPLRDTAERCHEVEDLRCHKVENERGYEVEVAPGVQGRTWGVFLLHRSAVQHLTRRSAPFLYNPQGIAGSLAWKR